MYSRFFTLFFVLLLAAGAVQGGQDFESEVGEARKVIKSFAKTLKGTLMAAMEEGGPVNAVSVCKVDAPRIARESAQASKWTVARTSLRVRNPDNAPDEWERGVLGSFAKRIAAGEDPAMIDHVERIAAGDDAAGGDKLRYMKAIPTGQVCVTCHGTNLDPELSARIDELYPEDRARGFEVGDLRGAFTLTRTLGD